MKYINTVLLMIVSGLVFHIMTEFKEMKTSVIKNMTDSIELNHQIHLIQRDLKSIQGDIEQLKKEK